MTNFSQTLISNVRRYAKVFRWSPPAPALGTTTTTEGSQQPQPLPPVAHTPSGSLGRCTTTCASAVKWMMTKCDKWVHETHEEGRWVGPDQIFLWSFV